MSTGLVSIASSTPRAAAANLSATAQSQSEKDRKTIAQNFDQFLGLLTTQLRNQSPLDPLDSNQFTQQLVQFSSVEQQLKTNDLLTALSKNLTGSSGGGASGGAGGKLNAASAAALIGVQVSVNGATSKLSKVAGSPDQYSAAYPVSIRPGFTNFKVTIADEQNNIVYSGGWAPGGSGDRTFVWDGKQTNGAPVDSSKKYNIQVTGELAGNPDSKSVMSTERTGVVTSVDLSGSEELVSFGPYSVPLSQVTRVARAGV
jgi:flagellar basal-body rod modification protein FlgD